MNAAVTAVRADRRAHPRPDLMRPAVVMHASGQGYPCVIVNGSPGGALLQVSGEALPSGELTLMDSDEGRLHELRVVWRRGPFVGIAYTATTPLP